MRAMGALFLLIVAVAGAAGCAGGSAAFGTNGVGLASPSPTIPDCRNQGSYNRAANLCVSNGP